MRVAADRASGLTALCGRFLVAPLLYRDVIWIALGLISASWLWRGLHGGSSWPGMVSAICAVAVTVELVRSRMGTSGLVAGPLALLLVVSPFLAGSISMVAAIVIGALVIGTMAKMEDDRSLCVAAFMLAVTALTEFFSGTGADAVGQFMLESEMAMLGEILALTGKPHEVRGGVLLLADRQVVLLTECSSFVLIAEAGVLTLAFGRLLRVGFANLVFVLVVGVAFTALLNVGRLMAMLLSPMFYGQLHNDVANQAMGFAICFVIFFLLFPARGCGE